MDLNLSELEFQLFQKFILDKCGIEISEEKAYLIESRLTKILVDSKLESFGDLYNHIRYTSDEVLLGKLIDAITTNETLWFRDKTPWLILEELYLPSLIEDFRSGKRGKIRIWSAATSTGQEAYSTAICIDRYLKRHKIWDVTLADFEIIATDISNYVLEIATNGRYDSISIMRGLDKDLKEEYFTQNDGAWEIAPHIQKAVHFLEFNLQNSFTLLGKFDIIFCRYVLIYFSDTLKSEILHRLYHSLDDTGVMFMGAYEMCSHLCDCFVTRQYRNGTYYTKQLDRGKNNYENIFHR